MSPPFVKRDPDEESIKDFRDCIKIIKGKFIRPFKKEHNKAIELYLGYRNYKDYASKFSFLLGPTGLKMEESGSHKKFNKRQKALLIEFDKRFFHSDKIPNSKITILIKDTLNVIDERTVKKWTDYLILMQFIKKDSIHYWTNKTSLTTIEELFPETITKLGIND